MAIAKTTNIVITGVGGQGNRTLMKILALAALENHSEVRVLSSASLGRLGGSITCHIRLGPSASPSIPIGEGDILVALEMNEALRTLPMMRRGALAFIHIHRRLPVTAGIYGMSYPSAQEIERIGMDKAIKSFFVPESLLSLSNTGEEMRFTQSANAVMLGAFCSYTELLPRVLIEQSLCQCLPQFAEQNLYAFTIGWQYGENLRGQNKHTNEEP